MSRLTVLTWKTNRFIRELNKDKGINCLVEYVTMRTGMDTLVWRFVKDRTDLLWSNSNTKDLRAEAESIALANNYFFVDIHKSYAKVMDKASVIGNSGIYSENLRKALLDVMNPEEKRQWALRKLGLED